MKDHIQVRGILALAALACAGQASAATIRVINAGVSGHLGVVAAITQLTTLGHTVTTGDTLADYSAFDQVWDLRYQTNLTAGDTAAFGAYLASGGRVYLTGENPSFDGSRNVSLQTLLAAVGAGSIIYSVNVASNSQTFTAAGAALNSPNAFASVAYLGARQISGAGAGFLVTESPAGEGSMVAWDFGQIMGAPNARMIALWDVDVFRAGSNGVNWTQNMADFLGANPPSTVPEPSTALSAIAGILLIGVGLAKTTKR